MKSSLLWEVNANRSLSTRCPIYSLCFKIDHSQLIVACANDLLFIDPKNGEIVEKRRPHQAPIYCVRCSPDGIFFASSSADGAVVISRSINNDGFIRYGAPCATKNLCWCPNKQMLVSCSSKEFHVWHPDDNRAARFKVEENIVSCSFSPSGKTFLLSFENGDVFIYDPFNLPNVLQSYHFTFPLTSVSYTYFDDTEYIITTDLERHVSLFKASDKTLVGKNSLTFEALSTIFIDGFFLISGISGRICLMTAGLSYLGEIESGGDFIWDTSINSNGELAIARRDGVVELRSIEFGLAFARSGSIVAYRTNANQIRIRNIVDQSQQDLTFLKIVHSIQMNSTKILIHFKDALFVYDSKTYEKISEIPGDFDNCEFALTETAIVYSKNKELKFIDTCGKTISFFTFRREITTISNSSEGVIVGCVDGTISFIVNDKAHLLVSHNCAVEMIERKEHQIALIDRESHLTIYNSFDSSVLRSIEYSKSFSFNDKVSDLFASSDGNTIYIFYKDCEPIKHYVEGILLAFVRNLLIVSNRGAIEIIPTLLPYEELINRNMWDDVGRLAIELGANDAQSETILNECIKRKSFEFAPLLIDKEDKSRSFLFAEILPNSPDSIIDETTVSDPQKLEENGDSQKALDAYASKGDWESVLRLAATNSNLVRQMADFAFPKKYSAQVAKLLLEFGFGDSAIRVLSNSKDFKNPAKAHVFLGQWIDAISLTRLSPSVSPVVYPKMAQLLFESNLWFESLVCLFVVNDSDIRAEALRTIQKCVISFDQHKFINLMSAFNDPERYWSLLDLSYVYLLINRLKKVSIFLPINVEDATEIFYMCHFICARYKMTPMKGVDFGDILILLLFSASILGLKRWVAYALREIMQLDLDEHRRRIAQLSALISKEADHNKDIDIKCPKCGNVVFSSGRMPLLVCGICGMKIAFSAYSGKPLPLIHISYKGKSNPVILIQKEPLGNEKTPELTSEFVSDEFLEKTPPEMFVIQRLKKTAGVEDQLWLNPTLCEVHVCNICGTMMNSVDYEKSVMVLDHCPICHGNEAEADDNQILAALRSFEAESPILF
ncbi:hypothetical protein TRFO_29922 [Tritrichomonas foetus]|uniref:Intraflagellar transport protein 122 homolog n=1 Tax=Tritrichomonas foetus TaxID=1144522 RepID=A0A1J4JZ76_9EUKA|nr:hypothetical protein TRFO_29922 [Tritrichomonas foetus]|eukprot:OHT02798.1 hypothetical protein TRFO_29922 [Tritrichomonas foetus]